MFGGLAPETTAGVTLYTDAYVVRGQVQTRARRLTDILNRAENGFLVLTQVTLDEFGSKASAIQSDYAQVNLGAVLFGVSDEPVEPAPELRMPKVSEQALISVPPFRIVGRIHVLPERDLRDALDELTGAFVPVTDATYWSEIVGEPRTTVNAVAFNHSRAQILTPYRVSDPWEGMGTRGSSGDATA
ncbi:MAG TPA: hypothetical protein VGK63_02920 [Candidatus Limnocylindrales bacterium]